MDDIRLISVDAIPIPSIIEHRFAQVKHGIRTPRRVALDTLIAAGFAANRAQAVRWALARIRDRPAYAELREHAREIENLRSRF